MSISTVASPPMPLAMEKNSRRVRFSLPEAKLTLHTDKRPVHGTSMYVNGTLINVTSTIHSTTDTKAITKSEVSNGGVFKSSLKASATTTGSNGIPRESSQYKVTFNVSKPLSSPSSPSSTVVMNKEPRHSLPTPTTYANNTAMMAGRRRMSKSSNNRGINTLPMIGRKSSSVEDIDEREREIEQVLPITNLNKYKSSEDLRDPTNFRMITSTKGNVLRLPEADANPYHKALKHSTLTSNTLRVPDYSETQPSCEMKKYKNEVDTMSCDNAENMDEFFEFVEKWRTNRLLNNKKIEDIFRNSSFQSRCSFKNSESKSSSLLSARLKAFKMSLDQVELVSKLLRASRNCNELLLKDCFKEILEHGITPKELNSTDKSGRTALSYICSTNLTNFLELFLHLPGIDVNKPDNEGNSALHFAAQAGQTEIVNMLLTKCKGINIDAKNNLGFTPLMKAALQGRTKTAKLLLFAGASPTATDPARNFRADQWARYCGRHQTAEMIETVARAKLLEKSTSNKWTHDVIPRSKTTSAMSQQQMNITNSSNGSIISPQQQQTSQSGGLRSKFSGFRKVFPFSGFSHKDKHKDKDDKRNGFVNVTENKGATEEFHNGEIVNYLTSSVVGGGTAQMNGSNKQIKSLCRPLTVPKLEVTYANNNNLIKKFENMPSNITEKSATTETHSEDKPASKKKINGIRKAFSERSKSLMNGGKQKVNTDAYF